MLTGIQHLHGTLRWVVLILMVFSIVKAFSGMSSGRSFGSGDYKRGLFTMISLHVQLLLGFILYFGKGWSSMLGNADAMADTIMRFFSLEHMVTMLLAVVLGTLGHSLAKRAEDDRTKFRRQAIWFTVSLVLILSSIPWPFRAGFEAYGWW
jgi:preprotein translocase subunit SecY